jgi:hypothetical protein
VKTGKHKRTIVAGRAMAVPAFSKFSYAARAARLLGVVVSTEEMQRYVRLIADDPAVVRDWRNIKQISGSQFSLRSIGEGGHGAAGNDHSNMLNIAQGLPSDGSDVLRPLPTGLVTCATDGQSTDLNNFEFAFVENANFVGLFKTLEYESGHDAVPFCC